MSYTNHIVLIENKWWKTDKKQQQMRILSVFMFLFGRNKCKLDEQRSNGMDEKPWNSELKKFVTFKKSSLSRHASIWDPLMHLGYHYCLAVLLGVVCDSICQFPFGGMAYKGSGDFLSHNRLLPLPQVQYDLLAKSHPLWDVEVCALTLGLI